MRSARIPVLVCLSAFASAPSVGAAPSAADQLGAKTVAYFSLELAHPGLRGQRTGGLGILAMDLVRGLAREIVPRGGQVVGVSLLYDHAWAQRIDEHGEQRIDEQEIPPGTWVERQVTRPVMTFPLEILGKRHQVAVYEERLGKARVLRLYAPGITRMLYNGDDETRLAQEVLLAIGGAHVLEQLKLVPDIVHLNEAHTALVAPAMRERKVFDKSVFVPTTHTPVEAGIERYPLAVWPRLGLAERWKGHFERNGVLDFLQGMMRFGTVTNAVSDEHAEVMRRMYPDFAQRIVGVQNGIDPTYWQDESIARLKHPTGKELWEVKQPLRAALVDEVERRTGHRLSLDKPIIAFTRRVTGYKRTYLMLRDQVHKICRDPAQGGLGGQIVVAGVAHPRDGEGKDWIKRFVELSKQPELKGRFVFVEDYLGPNNDLEFDRIAVRGADVWLTTPQHGLEASGTSDRRSLVNLGIQIWTPDTGGGRAYLTPFDEETRVGNGYFIDPDDPAGLYDQLGKVTRLFYRMIRNQDDTYLALLKNVHRTIPQVTIRRNVDAQIRSTYLPALYGPKILDVKIGPAVMRRRFDLPLSVGADAVLDEGLRGKDVHAELRWQRPGMPWRSIPMRLDRSEKGRARFVGELPPFEPGQHRYTVRVAPLGSDGWRSAPEERAVEFTDEDLRPDQVKALGLSRWAEAHRRLVPGLAGQRPAGPRIEEAGGDLMRLLGARTRWEFTDPQKQQPTELRPFEPLVIRNRAPFTVVSGPMGRRTDTEITSFQHGSDWVAVLRVPEGRRWLTFRWHTPGGTTWEGSNYRLDVRSAPRRPIKVPKPR
jgi:starch phosphorylase